MAVNRDDASLSVLFLAYLLSQTCLVLSKNQSLFILMVDGVRWNYIDENGLIGFPIIEKFGVRAQYVLPIFPSNTYPNWLTMVTGVYSESHGFVNNYMYDKNKDIYFEASPSSDDIWWWKGIEPIWITAEKRGIKSALYNWDGCNLEVDGIKASYCRPYRSYKLWPGVEKDTRRAAFEILNLFQQGYRLGLLYFEPVDGNGHIFGPESWIRKWALRQIDKILYDIQQEIEKKGMNNDVNVIVVSDHGMTNISFGRTKVIDINSVVSSDDVKVMLDVYCMSMLWPENDKEEKVYNDLINANLEGLQVYRKRDIPNIFHFRDHNRIAPILMLTNSSDYIIVPLNNQKKMKPYYMLGTITSFFLSGIHGCNQYTDKMSDMRAIFMARGPAFKNLISPPLHMVDHYNIFCHVLGIEPLPNNGSWHRIKDMLRHGSNL
ncbi:glycerophosphocholine cholinephosphodiesterase ENPP6-like [Centruroides vittatus]|uniref:glycerophosphocholine cholinephosphodiesterase ENPP6-like n=1 Tax=Centruroides vittatus TaxID=120091 RepID=UPI00350FF16D